MKYAGKRIKANVICYILIISIIVGLFAYFTQNQVYAYNQKTGIVKVDDALNVRTGPGTGYSKLTSNGANVKLTNGTKVTIQDEAYAADGAKWYKISFSYKGSSLSGYAHSNYIYVEAGIDYTPDSDFESYLTKQGFPESYKEPLRKLHASYPNWVFQADHLDYNWDEVVKNESVTGRSLIAMSSISSWKSTEEEAYNAATGKWYGFDGGSWAAASKELVAYALDPRNFLDEKYIFQFELLSFQSSYQTAAGLKSMLEGTFMANTSIPNGGSGGTMGYVDAIMEAAAASGVSPYSLASSIIQEQGKSGTSGSISGNVSGYKGYYNYYNWGAYAGSGRTAVENGLLYASKTDSTSLRPWNTRYKSLVGGEKLLGKNYINIGQDTIYYKKFDFVGTPYTHQYMTHIIAARNEGLSASNGYSDSMKRSIPIVFKIPVFKNMPETVCAIPTANGSSNTYLSSLKVSAGSLTPSFKTTTLVYDVTVENAVASIDITAIAADASSVVTGTGSYGLNVGNNDIDIQIKAESGAVKTYTIHVNRKAAATRPSADTNYSLKGLSADEKNGYMTGIAENMTVDNLKASIFVTNGDVKVLDSSGNGKTGVIGTGDIIQIITGNGTVYKQFTALLYGDVNGDGCINVKDAFLIRKDILGEAKLSGVYRIAADVSRNGDGITIKDAYIIKRHILGENKIQQN